MTKHKEISIFGLEDSEGSKDRGLFDRLQNLRYGRQKVDVDVLKQRLNDFLSCIQDVVQGIPDTLGDYTLDTITLAVEVSAKGQVSLLGTGGEIAGKGGLTFTLKRPTQNNSNSSKKK
jgi:hypothetical protein